MADKLTKVTGNDSLKKYFNSPYMGAYSISSGAEPIVTIASVEFGKITLDGGRKEEHVVLFFKEKSVHGLDEVKPLILNSTNQKTLEKLYGKGADVLIGKRIQLYVDPAVKAIGGGTTEGVRIRGRRPPDAPGVVYTCADCSEKIADASGFTAAQIAATTERRYGVQLCAGCSNRRKQAAQAEADNGTPNATAQQSNNTEVTADAGTE